MSLLSNIEKILEKLMYKRLYTFINNNNMIYNLQFRFWQHYSPNALIENNIRKALDERNIDCGVFLDLQKAFNTADHQILLAKSVEFPMTGLTYFCLIAIHLYP